MTDIEPQSAAVPVPVRRPDPWAMAAVARQRDHAAERLRKLEAENRELRAELKFYSFVADNYASATLRDGPKRQARRRLIDSAATDSRGVTVSRRRSSSCSTGMSDRPRERPRSGRR